MRFSDIRDVELPLGRLSVWSMSASTLERAAERSPDPRGPSYNQHGHISHALTRRVDPDLFDILTSTEGVTGKAAPTGWLGVSFDVPSVSSHCLRRGFEAWMCRHETLRSGFRTTGAGIVDVDFERFTMEPGEVHLEEVDLGEFSEVPVLADTLDDLFNRSTDAVSWPAHTFAVVRSAKRTTVIMAFDHVNVDGYSIMLAVSEVREILDALHEGRPNQLTPVPSYLDFVQEEMAHASQSSTSHEAVEIWKGFLGEPGTLPGFPLDDGLPPGSQVPQEASCIPILDAHQGAVFGDWCRANGVSSATGFLAALSLAFTRVGRTIDLRLGGDQPTETVGFRSLVSTHTRHAAHWAEALGWFTAIAPLDVEFRDDQELVEILPIVGEAWARAKRGAGLPMSRIGELLDVPLQPRFVVSYLDARYVRSADRWQNWNAQAYLGDVGPTDEVYLWINRMLDETYVTWRYPGNDVCRAQIEAVTEAMRQIIVQSPLVTTQTALDAGEMSTQWL